MQIQVSTNREIHRGLVPSLSWFGQELITIGDDGSIHRWDGIKSGRPISPASLVVQKTQNEKALPIFTNVSFHPSASSGRGVGTSGGGGGIRGVVDGVDLLALSCSDGTVRLATASDLREIKKIQAHTGAVVRVRWSNDGTAFCSCGEDGTVKESEVNSLAIGITRSGKNLIIKSLKAGKQIAQWKAHGRSVTCIDWSIRTGQILSASEDCTYAVWDAFGQRMFASVVHSHVITSVAWAPNGENFAVGSFNTLKLCDAMGWTHVQQHLPKVGNLLDTRWMQNGTQLAAAGGGGAVVFAQLIGRTLCWGSLEAVLIERSRVKIQDLGCGKTEMLDFHRDRVVEMALGFEHLVVIAGTQCFVYNVTNLNTPIIFDFEGGISLLTLADSHFLTMDCLYGIRVWDYEGQNISHLKVQNLLPKFANTKSISLSPEVVAIISSTDKQLVQMYDTSTGHALPDGNISHDSEVIEIALSQFDSGGILNRRLVILDKNKNLWIAPAMPIPGSGNAKVKLLSQVDSFCWSNVCDVLSAMADGHLVTWIHSDPDLTLKDYISQIKSRYLSINSSFIIPLRLYPNGVYVDADLMEAAYVSKDRSELGSNSQIIAFDRNRISIRKADGAIVATSIPPFPAMLHSLVQKNNWDEVVRLCRFAQNKQLWACAACMAIARRELEVAENALAAIKMVDKLEYIVYIRGMRTETCQNAQLALFQRRPDEAERILLQVDWDAVREMEKRFKE